MRRTLVTLALGLILAAQGCAPMGVGNPFSNDPLTGGADTASSQLLGVPLPAGMQRYASHSYMNYGVDGGREGLETLRGNVDATQAAQSMFTALQGQGWQLRLSLRKGDRSLHVYDKGNSLAVLAFRRQTVLTILEIWTGGRLPDGSALSLPDAAESGAELPGEEYPPLSDETGQSNSTPPPAPGPTEQWGGSGDQGGGAPTASGGLQERNL
ncbi:hypothetical protein [uncultured Desulfovibrio sp.]|uniref:hypothetical protein n=1 Tax=uncultured Desulfovibrio sp. TaxID=167968 RepID=UPI00039D121B|nr:hypothetical protein [uncultured Desulfovibrio sp.]